MKLSATARRHPIATAVATLFVLALTVGAGMIGAHRTEPAYQSEGIVLIIPPGAGSQVATNNPFVNLDQNIAQLAQALSTRMSAPDIVTGLQSRAPSLTDYTATVRYDNAVVNSMPTSQVQFTVTGTDAQVVRDAVQQLMVSASDNLKQIQVHAGVKADTLAQTVQLVAPTEPTAMPVSAARAAGLWAISGLLIGLAVLALTAAVVRFFGAEDADGAAEPAVAADAVDAVSTDAEADADADDHADDVDDSDDALDAETDDDVSATDAAEAADLPSMAPATK